MITKTNKTLRVVFNEKRGSVSGLYIKNDEHGMNWVINSQEYGFGHELKEWGIGFVRINNVCRTWNEGVTEETPGGLRWQTVMPEFRMSITRTLGMTDYKETYVLKNLSRKTLRIDGFGIYVPFCDVNRLAKDCLFNNCHAHIWTGKEISYVCALRKSGVPPHIGLTLTKGELNSYAIETREHYFQDLFGMNPRGHIMLMVTDRFRCPRHTIPQPVIKIVPGRTYRLQWRLFVHSGWKEFHQKGRIPEISFSSLTPNVGEKMTLSVNGKLFRGWSSNSPGTGIVKFSVHGRKSLAVFQRRRICAEELIRKRCNFIIERQQINVPGGTYDGACFPYDNEFNRVIYEQPTEEKIAMGELLCCAGRMFAERKYSEAARRYERFLRQFISDEYDVYPNAIRTGERPLYRRLYNYPLAASFYYEMYQEKKQLGHLLTAWKILRRFFAQGGDKFYAINIRFDEICHALRQAGKTRQAEQLMDDALRLGKFIIVSAENIPGHEEKYEQSIVAPAASHLFRLYRITGEKKHLEYGKRYLCYSEMHNGYQPDFRLHDIGIRHWDGFWFGKYREWGDIFPHYWTVLTAEAFYLFSLVASDEIYRDRCKRILDATLSAFSEDGRASCAFVYPSAVDNRPAHYADPLANDQDWALVYYLRFLHWEAYRLKAVDLES